MKVTQKEISWTPVLIKKLRGKRTQTEFGTILGVPKNTVWRWENGQANPTIESARRLSAVADKERFLKDWKLAGSGEIAGDLEEGSKIIRQMVMDGIRRSARLLDD